MFERGWLRANPVYVTHLSCATPYALVAAVPAEWSGLLKQTMSFDAVYCAAADVAAMALIDMSLTVEDQELLWQSPVSRILKRPLPLDRSSKDKPAVMLELLDPADVGLGTEPLFERVWKKLMPSFTSTAQRSSMLLLTGVSGAGKTKAAFDIGRSRAIVVMTRIWEQGSLTAPWRLLREVTRSLHGQSLLCGSCQRLSISENKSAIAALLLLLSCQLEWAIAVYSAAKAAPSAHAHDEHAFHEAALRAQRNGTGHRAVHALFAHHLKNLLEVSADKRIVIPLEPVLQRLRNLNASLPSTRPLVWCYDEVQALLTEGAFDGFFDGTFEPLSPPVHQPAAPEAEAADVILSPDLAGGSTSVTSLPFFPALPEDIACCNAEIRRSCTRGWFYGLLVVVRLTLQEFRWGHILCGSSLRLNRELLQAHSPAQGVSDSIDADVRLDADVLRTWYSKYLTADAMQGLDDRELRMLVGRPLFGSCLFEQLHGMLALPTAELQSKDPSVVVRDALTQAVADATSKASIRVEDLWVATYLTAQGERPQTLIAWLYFLLRMGWGGSSVITPPTMSAEVMDAVQKGVLHVRRADRVIHLQDEPVTAAAILQVGDLRISGTATIAEDSVVRALGRRVSGAFGDNSCKGSTAEDVFAWTLLRRSLRGPMSLQELLAPFLGNGQFPPALVGYEVHLKAGLACDVALGAGSANRTFLELLERPDGHHLLLHHTQSTAAGADLAFLARRSPAEGSPFEYRAVLLQINNAADTTVANMLASVDMGCWYPDATVCKKKVETGSHVAFRKVLEAHPDWADPVRVLVSARPWDESTLRAVRWLNVGMVPQQPVLCLRFPQETIGTNISQNRAVATLHPPKDSRLWWPTPVRHWPTTGPKHPQASLPAVPAESLILKPSHRVRFSLIGHRVRSELLAIASSAGRHTVLIADDDACVVTFVNLDAAMRAVADAGAGALRVANAEVAAGFVRVQGRRTARGSC